MKRAKYFVLLKHDYIRYSFIYFIKKKSDGFNYSKKLKLDIK